MQVLIFTHSLPIHIVFRNCLMNMPKLEKKKRRRKKKRIVLQVIIITVSDSVYVSGNPSPACEVWRLQRAVQFLGPWLAAHALSGGCVMARVGTRCSLCYTSSTQASFFFLLSERARVCVFQVMVHLFIPIRGLRAARNTKSIKIKQSPELNEQWYRYQKQSNDTRDKRHA